MSRSAHSQSKYRLRQLPRCSRCKQEFTLVLSSYGVYKPLVWEWECFKCHKVVRKEYLQEEDLSPDEQFFYDKSRELQDEDNKRRKSSSRTL
jgi:hypothetical protein